MITKAVYIILAIWIGLSSMGFVLNKHICQNELKHVALFVEAANCHSKAKAAAMPADCPMHKKMQEQQPCGDSEKKNCCDNQSEYLKLEQDQQVENHKLELKLPQPNFIPIAYFATFVKYTTPPSPHYLNYKPPLIHCNNRLSFLQCFLC